MLPSLRESIFQSQLHSVAPGATIETRDQDTLVANSGPSVLSLVPGRRQGRRQGVARGPHFQADANDVAAYTNQHRGVLPRRSPIFRVY